jgi:DEAD/DEAH box helicase domain-containing protein
LQRAQNNMRKIVFDIETRNVPFGGSFDPRSLDLSVIGVYDSTTDAYTSYFQEDLNKLWPLLEQADMLIGYNSDHFDIPLLDKYYPGDLTKIKSLDLLKEVKNTLGRRLKLDTLAEATLGTNKSADGLKAVEWWKKGEYEKVVKYCLDDVRITKELYDYAFKNGLLKYKELGKVKEIKLNTAHWEKPAEKAAMTHTLPF